MGLNQTAAPTQNGGGFEFEKFGIPNVAKDNEFKDNLKDHTNFLQKN